MKGYQRDFLNLFTHWHLEISRKNAYFWTLAFLSTSIAFYDSVGGCIGLHASMVVKSAQRFPQSLLTLLPLMHSARSVGETKHYDGTGTLLFSMSCHLTHSAVSYLLRDSSRASGVPYDSLKGRSFRIGAASVATAVGLLDWLYRSSGSVLRLLPALY